jgi:hypothetical protein
MISVFLDTGTDIFLRSLGDSFGYNLSYFAQVVMKQDD